MNEKARLTGTIVHGKGLGHTVGMPTANLRCDEGSALPEAGVYASLLEVDGQTYFGVTNVPATCTTAAYACDWRRICARCAGWRRWTRCARRCRRTVAGRSGFCLKLCARKRKPAKNPACVGSSF